MKLVNTMLNGLMRNCRYPIIKTSHSASAYPMYRALNYIKCESDKWLKSIGYRREGARKAYKQYFNYHRKKLNAILNKFGNEDMRRIFEADVINRE